MYLDLIIKIVSLFLFTSVAALFFGAESLVNAQAQAQEESGQLYTGEMNSIINTGGATWIAKGNWDLVLEGQDDVNDFTVDMIWFTSDGIKSHTHYIKDFDADTVTRAPDGSINMSGDADIGTEGETTWSDVPVTANIGAGKTLSVLLDDIATDSHFGGQTMYGLVDSVQECGSTPGAGMTLRASCSVQDDGEGAAVIQGPSGQTIIAGP
jgi:hypothetical protein